MIQGLGDKLKALRLKRGLSQAELARALDITAALISAYENNGRIPSLEKLMRLASFFSTSTDYLLGIERSDKLNLDGLSPEEASAITTLIQSLKAK